MATDEFDYEDVEHFEVFGKYPERWRGPLGALRMTLWGDPNGVDVQRAQHECEELVRILNEVYDD